LSVVTDHYLIQYDLYAELFIPPDSTVSNLWIEYGIPKLYYLYYYMTYLILCIFPFIVVFLWMLELDPVFICLNSTLLDLRTGYLVPSFILLFYLFVTTGCVYQVVDSMFQTLVPVFTITFWLTTHHSYSQSG